MWKSIKKFWCRHRTATLEVDKGWTCNSCGKSGLGPPLPPKYKAKEEPMSDSAMGWH